MSIDISGLDKAEVLAALYNAARPQGMGFLRYDPTPMSVDEAWEILGGKTLGAPTGHIEFDYLKGRVMKVDLGGDMFEEWLYDRDNGEGAAKSAIECLRATGNPNGIEIQAQHASQTRQAGAFVLDHLKEKSHFSAAGGTPEYHLGYDGLAPILRPQVKEVLKRVKSPLD